METTYYTVPARRVTVSSTAPAYEQPLVRELMCLPRQAPAPARAQGRVIDFTAWKEEHSQLVSEAQPSPRPACPTTSRPSRLLVYGEWAATLAVMATMLLLVCRILVA